jgi:hypothetical protein
MKVRDALSSGWPCQSAARTPVGKHRIPFLLNKAIYRSLFAVPGRQKYADSRRRLILQALDDLP